MPKLLSSIFQEVFQRQQYFVYIEMNTYYLVFIFNCTEYFTERKNRKSADF